jgi:hypothetical protein
MTHHHVTAVVGKRNRVGRNAAPELARVRLSSSVFVQSFTGENLLDSSPAGLDSETTHAVTCYASIPGKRSANRH